MKCLLVLFVIAAFFATGEALIRCYECTGTKACDDPFDKSGSGVQEVIYAAGCVCAKQVLEYYNNDKLTTRTCVIPNQFTPRFPDARTVVPFKSLTLNLCGSDLCNGASSIIATQLIFFAIAVLFVFTHWQ